MEEAEVDRFSTRHVGESVAEHVVHRLRTDVLKKCFLTSRKNGKMYS
jgi:hypothetical protein